MLAIATIDYRVCFWLPCRLCFVFLGGLSLASELQHTSDADMCVLIRQSTTSQWAIRTAPSSLRWR